MTNKPVQDYITPNETVLNSFAKVIGKQNIVIKEQDMQPFLVEWRDRYFGKAACILCPETTEEVSQLVRIANDENIAIVPQGGNTGLVGGQIPDETGKQVVLSLSQLNKVRDVSIQNNTIIVEAGVILEDIHKIASENDRLFPLSFGSKDKCQIGGNLATNAGGLAVLNYGTARDLVLGLEVVLSDGQIWDGLRTLRKDNTGYSLKDLFIGSEGTLGIITAAVLKLYPKPVEEVTAFIGLRSLEDVPRLYSLSMACGGQKLTAFEMLPHIALEFILKHLENTAAPLKDSYPWYVLLKLSGMRANGQARLIAQTIINEGLSEEYIGEGTIAWTDEQSEELWRMRSNMSRVQKNEGGSIKHDISVPIAKIPEFITRANDLIELMIPGARPVPFGHFGDGNIHYNISQPIGMDKEIFLKKWEEVNIAIHEIVVDMGGAISAEHGIGQMKRDLLKQTKSEVEIKLMEDIKNLLDPKYILNPGKVL